MKNTWMPEPTTAAIALPNTPAATRRLTRGDMAYYACLMRELTKAMIRSQRRRLVRNANGYTAEASRTGTINDDVTHPGSIVQHKY